MGLNIGGFEDRPDWPKMGPSLLIATCLILAIRTARWAVRSESQMIGALATSWQIAIPPGNLVGGPESLHDLESIVITFEGTFIGFTPGRYTKGKRTG